MELFYLTLSVTVATYFMISAGLAVETFQLPIAYLVGCLSVRLIGQVQSERTAMVIVHIHI